MDLMDGWLSGLGIDWMVTLKELRSTARCPSGDQWWVVSLKGRYWDRCCLTSLLATWAVELSAYSASLPTTPSCVLRLTHWREGMTSRGILTSWRGGPVWTSWSSPSPSGRSCTWIRAIPSTNTAWAENRLRTALREGLGGADRWKARHEQTVCSLGQEGQSYPGLHQKKHEQQVEGGDSAPLLCFGETPPGILPPALEPSAQERHGAVGAGPEEGHRNDQKAGSPLLWGKAERLGGCSACRRDDFGKTC